MAPKDAISGQEKLDIFKQMEKEGILLNVHLRRTGLKQLTVIKRLITKEDDWYFLIECPQSFQKKAEPGKWKLAFAFIGEQGVPYRFNTVGGEMVGSSDVLIRVPDSIERKLRRKHFRIKTHPAALLRASIGGQEAEMKMIDISQGGALVMFAREEDENRMLATGQELTDIRIKLLPGEKAAEALRVNQAEVRSVALEPKSGTYHFGLMFIELSRLEEKLIKERIYVDQRQMLRKKAI